MSNGAGNGDHERLHDKPTEIPLKVPCYDDFLRMGRYSARILLVSEFLLLAAAGNMMFMMFAGAAPKSVSCIGSNFTIDDMCKSEYSYKQPPDGCEVVVDAEFISVNVDFGYLCKDVRYVKSGISLQMIGVLIGTLLFGNLSDRYGRKKILIATFYFTTAVSIALTFSTTHAMFTALRTLQGFFNGGLIGTYGVYKMEHIPRKHRFWVATIIAWAPNMILLTLIGYWTAEWRKFQWVLVLISLPACIMFLFVHESPRWLLQRGKIDAARKVMMAIQRIDRTNDHKNIEIMLQSEYQKVYANRTKAKRYNSLHLFYNREMAIATIVFCFGKFFTSMVNYGLVFNVESISGSLFMNTIIMGVLRWALNIVIGILDWKVKWVGRKVIHFASLASIAVCVDAIGVVYYFDVQHSHHMIIRVSTIIAASVASQVFLTKSISTMEFYPTAIRNSAIAVESTSSRIGTILSPQLFIYSPWQWLPYLLLAVGCLTDAVSFQATIPETKGRPMPDRMPEKKKGSVKKAGGKNDEPLLLVKA